MNEGAAYYARRKIGEKKGFAYFLSSLSPLFILLLITAALSFSLSFIISMSEGIDKLLAVMGSGSVRTLSCPDSSLLPEGAEISETITGTALLYAENGENAVMVKGIGEDYLEGIRKSVLDIEYGDEGINPVIVSSSLASSLSLNPGDRLSMLLWEKEEGRARPLLVTVHGVFRSVYPQLDKHLVYAPIDLVDGPSSFEILLPEGQDAEVLVSALWKSGIPAESYRTMYSSLYQNVRQSIGILSFLIILVAALVAFFSSDAAHFYISRDRNDIQGMRLLGIGRREIIGVYMLITVSYVAVAAVLGMVLGIIISSLSPSLISFISSVSPALLDYYITSFEVVIPVRELVLMLLAMIAVSSISVFLMLRRSRLLP